MFFSFSPKNLAWIALLALLYGGYDLHDHLNVEPGIRHSTTGRYEVSTPPKPNGPLEFFGNRVDATLKMTWNRNDLNLQDSFQATETKLQLVINGKDPASGYGIDDAPIRWEIDFWPLVGTLAGYLTLVLLLAKYGYSGGSDDEDDEDDQEQTVAMDDTLRPEPAPIGYKPPLDSFSLTEIINRPNLHADTGEISITDGIVRYSERSGKKRYLIVTTPDKATRRKLSLGEVVVFSIPAEEEVMAGDYIVQAKGEVKHEVNLEYVTYVIGSVNYIRKRDIPLAFDEVLEGYCNLEEETRRYELLNRENVLPGTVQSV